MLNDLYSYDIALGIWLKRERTTTNGEPPSPRFGLGLSTVSGRLYVFGGNGSTGLYIAMFFNLKRIFPYSTYTCTHQ